MTKHEYICKVTEVVREKSDCFKRRVGAVFVNNDFEILATGYNAPPRGFDHCDHSQVNIGTCWGKGQNPLGQWSCARNIHAEMNAIAQAAKRGTALRGSILYCTYAPCINCARMLVNVGVWKVSVKEMNSDGGDFVLVSAGIEFVSWENDI